MRLVGQALLWLSLVGCSRENPWFAIKGAGQETTTGTASGGTSGSDSGPDDTTTGESGTSAAMTSTSTTSTTGPSTTSSSTSSSSTTGTETGDISTGDISTGDTSTGDTSTGDSSGSSTGDLEENVLYDLYDLCPTTAVWSDFNHNVYLCEPVPALPISVSQTKVLYQGKSTSGILVYPAQLLGKYLDGVYELMLMNAVNPRFRAVLLFPPDAGIKDAVVGQIYVESVKSGTTVLSAPPIMLMPGGSSIVDLDLSGVQDEVAGLLLHLQVTVATQVPTMESRAVWLSPRIVEVP